MNWHIIMEWAFFSLAFPFALYLLFRAWWEGDGADSAPEVYTMREEEKVHFKETAFIERLDKDDY